MNQLTYEEVEFILKNGDFSKLKEKFENEFFDAKEKLYDFSSQFKDNKYELCKDVSSFANNKGGFIILGVVAIKLGNSPHEKVESVKGINSRDVLIQTYIQHLKAGVYPEIAKICSFGFSVLDGQDVFYIKISPESSNRPYLVKKDNYFSYITRTESHGLQENIEYVHETIRYGIQYEQNLLRLERKLDQLLDQNREKTTEDPLFFGPDRVQLFKQL